MRRSFYLGAVTLIVVAAFVVPMPFFALEPGPAVPVAEQVRVGRSSGELNGSFLLTTVRLSETSAVGTVGAWVDDEVDLVPRQAVIPPGVDEREYVEAQKRLFQESATVAAAVGLSRAGYDVRVSGGGAQVAGVVAGSPADGKLREGDVITAIDGRRIRLASDVAEATARADDGDQVTVVFVRGDERRTVKIRLEEVSEIGRPGLGVAVRTIGLDIDLPVPVRFDRAEIGGPSAGLMVALTVFDLADPVDLAGGRTIAGTGTIDLSGSVGVVGGVAQKVIAARKEGAELFLVPAEEYEDARRAAGGSLQVRAVETMDEALEVVGGARLQRSPLSLGSASRGSR